MTDSIEVEFDILNPSLVILSETKDLGFDSGKTKERISLLDEKLRFFASLRMTIAKLIL